MGKIKNFLAYTNPIAIVVGIPLLTGFVLAAIVSEVSEKFDGVKHKTKRIVNSLEI